MVIRAGRGRGRRAAPWCLLCVSLLAFVACGGPEYTYVTNSQDRTYLKIPNSWHAVDAKAIGVALGIDPAMAESADGLWVAGYDADAAPSLAHVLGSHAESPAVLILVRDVPQALRGQISLDWMRDLFQPVSPTSRQQIAANPASPLSGFALIADEVLTPGGGLRGVHVVYRYRIQGGPYQVFDKTVYVNDDASKVYLFYVRCSTQCYQDRQQEIERVVSSFTVRENP
jgi:hypothetical protein